MRLQRVVPSLLLLAAIASAQSPEASTVPRAKDGKPDLSGIWSPDGKFSGDFSKALKPCDKMSMLPAATNLMKTRKPKSDPAARCLPMGVPRLAADPEKIVQGPGLIVILYEGDIHSYRQIFLDGRTHPKDLDPTWYGDSIGKWEGDTLVVDTIGFNDRTWLDSVGHPHTEQLHVTERYRRPSIGNLELEVLIDDPGAYLKPFTVKGAFRLLANREIRERTCYSSPADK